MPAVLARYLSTLLKYLGKLQGSGGQAARLRDLLTNLHLPVSNIPLSLSAQISRCQAETALSQWSCRWFVAGEGQQCLLHAIPPL